ncbi:MAG: WG repeat-containing protein [Bacteroidaceae bacterium]|nr:WG repeat-containing protein [Bacteroidaceae bacterium]
MKKIIASLIFTIIFTTSYAQLIPDVNNKDKWGFVDSLGNVVVKHKYNSVTPFVNGRAKVQKGDNYGIIDEMGVEVLKTSYRIIEDYNGKCYKVASGGKIKDGVLFDENWGFISYDGEVILAPQYSKIGDFIDGVAYVQSKNKYGFITEDLSVLVPCIYSAVGLFNEYGYVWVNKGGRLDSENSTQVTGGKYGVYNKRGEVVVPVEYAVVATFKLKEPTQYTQKELKKMSSMVKRVREDEGSYRFLERNNEMMRLFGKLDMSVSYDFFVSTRADGSNNGVIASDGTILVPVNMFDAVAGVEEGFAPVYNSSRRLNYWNVSQGELLSSAWYADGTSFQNGLAICRNKSGDYFFIDQNNKVVSPHYSYISPMKEDVYIVQSKVDNKMGLLDKYGNVVVEPIYAPIYPTTEGGLFGAFESETGLGGYINNKGEVVIPFRYVRGSSFKNGYSMVKRDSHWGVVNLQGQEIVECKWDDILAPQDTSVNRIWVKNADLWYCVDLKTGTLAFDKGYETMSNYSRFAPMLACVLVDGKAGLIDVNGDVIIPFILDNNVSVVKEAYAMLMNTGRAKWTDVDTYRFALKNNKNRHKSKLYQTIDETMWDY